MDVADDMDSWLTLAAISGLAQVLGNSVAALPALLSHLAPGPFTLGSHRPLVHPGSQLEPSHAPLQHHGWAGAAVPWLL